MKTTIILSIISFFFLAAATGQEKYATKTGEIAFEASVPSFEEVKAENSNVSAVLDVVSGNFAALALMKGFRFKVALMEEHFNENYIESSKYPKATFKGTIQDFSLSDLSGESKYLIKGTMSLHGVDKNLEVPAIISIKNGAVYINTQFVLRPEEFDIKIPSIVSNKIADEVNVSAVFMLYKQ